MDNSKQFLIHDCYSILFKFINSHHRVYTGEQKGKGWPIPIMNGIAVWVFSYGCALFLAI
jgi:hypothetical protein